MAVFIKVSGGRRFKLTKRVGSVSHLGSSPTQTPEAFLHFVFSSVLKLHHSAHPSVLAVQLQR